MPTVFMVAEKPSLSGAISKVLAGNSQLYSHRCSYNPCTVYEWNGQFLGLPVLVLIFLVPIF